MKKIRITQIKSGIDRPERQKLTLRALGLNKMNSSREVEATAPILGMVRAVNHLIKIEEVAGSEDQNSVSVQETSARAPKPEVIGEIAAEPVETAPSPEGLAAN